MALKLVMGARNRTYPILIPCSESILELIRLLELTPEPILEPIPEPIPEPLQEQILELTSEPISELTLNQESIPELALESESAPETDSTWESRFALETDSELSPELKHH